MIVDIQAVLAKFNHFAAERDWEQFHTIKNLSIALSVEVSELVEIFQWATDSEIKSWIESNKDKQQQISEELADIFMYLIKIADKAKVDLDDAVAKKMEKNAIKYPVEKAKGNAKKYTEL